MSGKKQSNIPRARKRAASTPQDNGEKADGTDDAQGEVPPAPASRVEISMATKPREDPGSADNVRVFVRCRPLLPSEALQRMCIKCDKNVVEIGPKHSFAYDEVFQTTTTQKDLYVQTAAKLVKNVLRGENTSILAYGQTGSGKTYTMGTSPDATAVSGAIDVSSGIIPRFLNDVFQRLQSTAKAGKFSAKASFLEIYNETLVDLLNPQTSVSMKLNLYEDKHGIRVEGLTER